jgi:hypothetical protein
VVIAHSESPRGVIADIEALGCFVITAAHVREAELRAAGVERAHARRVGATAACHSSTYGREPRLRNAARQVTSWRFSAQGHERRPLRAF